MPGERSRGSQLPEVAGEFRGVAATCRSRDRRFLVPVVRYPAGDAGEEEIVAPALQPSNQVPQRNAADGLGERDRIETGILKALDETQAIGFHFNGLQGGKRCSSGGGKSGFRALDALLLQPAQDLRGFRKRQRESEAAAAHSREQALGLRGDKQKNRVR